MSDWVYQGRPFIEDDIGDSYGFIYEIVNLTNNRRYIGKKFFTKAKTKQVNGKKKKTRVSSDWEKYWSSSEELKTDVKSLGEDKFTRTILHLCKTRSECSYRETKEIFNRDALLKEEYYNSWVSVRINAKNLLSMRNQ